MAENIKKSKPEEHKDKKEDREIIIYHDDIDGATSAYIIKKAKKLRSTSKNIAFVQYDRDKAEIAEKEIRKVLRTNANLYFVDISPETDFLNELMAPGNHGKRKVKSINIIDHHKTVIKDLENYSLPIPYAQDELPPKLNIVIKPTAPSAAKLVWEQVMDPAKKIPDYVQIVDKMDRNNLKTKDEFAAAAYIDSKSLASPAESIKTVSGLARINFNTMAARGRPIIAAQKQVINQLLLSHTSADIEISPDKKITVPMVNANVRHFGRQIDSHLVELGKEKGEGLAFAWHQQASGKVYISIRSDGEPDSGKIASYLCEKFNIKGGGHDDSAAIIFPSLCEFEQQIKQYDKATQSANNKPVEKQEADINIDIQRTVAKAVV